MICLFRFVQLSTINYEHTNLNYPILRWKRFYLQCAEIHIPYSRNHQTADFGTVPNPRMSQTFMAVAVDTYDEENGIHPRFKQVTQLT